MKISEQSERPMATVLVFSTCDVPASREHVRSNSFECLDASLLIDRDCMHAFAAVQLDGVPVRLTDFKNLCIPSFEIIYLRKQPVLVSVWLNIGPILKKTSPWRPRSWAQFPA